jgi:putative intracellular protease/amidase
MKVLFIVSSADIGFWLAELTHPYWHMAERGCQIDIASPTGGKITIAALSDPYAEGTWEGDDLVSKGFLSDERLVAKLASTIALKDVHVDQYDAVHIVGGGGAAVDLYPNDDVKRVLKEFWKADKCVGAICHGSIALGNIPDLVKGRVATGFSRAEDALVEESFGKDFIPNWPQVVMEEAGIEYVKAEPWGQKVSIDGNLITGQNQQSASEYSIAFNHLLFALDPVSRIDRD